MNIRRPENSKIKEISAMGIDMDSQIQMDGTVDSGPVVGWEPSILCDLIWPKSCVLY